MTSKKCKPEMPAPRQVTVDMDSQTLRVTDGSAIAAEFPISTSIFGPGFEEGSFRTPTGRFVIHGKFGDDAPAWTIFKSRQNTGQIASPGGTEDHVLSRILTLDGLDPDNRNTLSRYVYIHGTNQEDLIGTPASHGCIRLRNNDMITLYDMVPLGMTVKILPPSDAKKSTSV